MNLSRTAAELRATVIGMSHAKKCPHLGSALSCLDITTTLYGSVLRIDPKRADDPDRDRFILSKGHAAPALYATLHRFGFFGDDVLERFNEDGAELAEQPSPGCVPGMEAATGSLGHGLPIGLGMALAAKIQGRDYKAFVCLSDGECNEGSVWEAAMTAPALSGAWGKGLDNLCAIVDYNKLQATGRSHEILNLPNLAEKWRAFGWDAVEVDGHDLDQLVKTFTDFRDANTSGKPKAVIAHTVKGKGVPFMEDDNNWHYRIPNADEVAQARQLLGVAE
ncbi:MAG: transketolase [Planctomycetota bacterium]